MDTDESISLQTNQKINLTKSNFQKGKSSKYETSRVRNPTAKRVWLLQNPLAYEHRKVLVDLFPLTRFFSAEPVWATISHSTKTGLKICSTPELIKPFCYLVWKFQKKCRASYRDIYCSVKLHFISIFLDKEVPIFDSARTCEYHQKILAHTISQPPKYFWTKLKFFWKLSI